LHASAFVEGHCHEQVSLWFFCASIDWSRAGRIRADHPLNEFTDNREAYPSACRRFPVTISRAGRVFCKQLQLIQLKLKELKL